MGFKPTFQNLGVQCLNIIYPSQESFRLCTPIEWHLLLKSFFDYFIDNVVKKQATKLVTHLAFTDLVTIFLNSDIVCMPLHLKPRRLSDLCTSDNQNCLTWTVLLDIF